MATKTFEELKQLAIQIRDEKTNKQNTATRVGTAMLEHINKLEQDYYDKTQTDEELTKRDEKLTELSGNLNIIAGKINFTYGEFYTNSGNVSKQENWSRTNIDVKDCIGKSYNLTLYSSSGSSAYFLIKGADGSIIENHQLTQAENSINGIIPEGSSEFLVSNRWATNDSPYIEIEDFDLFYKAASEYDLNTLDKTVTNIEKKLPRSNQIVNMPEMTWEQGGITAGGEESSSGTFYTNRIRTKEYFQAKSTNIELNCEDGFGYRVFQYSQDKVFESYKNYDTGGENNYTTEANKLYRFCILKNPDAAITPSEFDESKFEVIGLEGEEITEGEGKPLEVADKKSLEELKKQTNDLEGRISNLESASVGAIRNNNLEGKKVVFIGDSITAGFSASSIDNAYPSIFCKLYNAILVNKGVSSTCIANNTSNGMSSQRFVTRAGASDLQDASLIVVFGGTNDFSYDTKPIGDLFIEEDISASNNIGDKKRVAPKDTDTFSGALHELILTIRGNAPTVPIVFMTPMNRGRYNANNPNSDEKNKNGDYLSDFSNAIKSICAFYSIPVLDLQAVSELDFLNESIASKYSSDNLHPKDLGHELIGKLLYRFVENNVVIL